MNHPNELTKFQEEIKRLLELGFSIDQIAVEKCTNRGSIKYQIELIEKKENRRNQILERQKSNPNPIVYSSYRTDLIKQKKQVEKKLDASYSELKSIHSSDPRWYELVSTINSLTIDLKTVEDRIYNLNSDRYMPETYNMPQGAIFTK